MFYPGQIVFLPPKKVLALYLGQIQGKYLNDVEFEVLLHDEEEPNKSDVERFDYKDLAHIIQPDKTTVTGTSIYYGPKNDKGKYIFRKRYWGSTLTNEELSAKRKQAIREMNKLRKEPWFLERYFPNEIKSETKQLTA